ncbi:hypothetical protein [Solidesulfovibrio sp.]
MRAPFLEQLFLTLNRAWDWPAAEPAGGRKRQEDRQQHDSAQKILSCCKTNALPSKLHCQRRVQSRRIFGAFIPLICRPSSDHAVVPEMPKVELDFLRNAMAFNLKKHWRGSMWVFAAGMRRSGSTVQYQIVKELIKRSGSGCDFGWIDPEKHCTLEQQCNKPYEFNLLKSHEVSGFIKTQMSSHDGIAVYSHRCILDVVSSLMEKNKRNYTDEQIRSFVLSSKQTHEQWIQWDNVIVQNYQQIVLHLHECVQEIAFALKIEISIEEVNQIADRLHINNQRKLLGRIKYADNLVEVDANNVYDPDSLLHLNHISDGGIGRYKKNLTPGEIEIIKSVWPDGIHCSP